MKTNLMTFLLPVVIVVLGHAAQSAQSVPSGLGSVEGQVVDASTGVPIAKATVIAEPDDPPAAGKLAHALADDGGRFLLDLAPGSYVIAGSKEQDFYPNTDNAALAVDLNALPKVLVGEGRPVRGVILRLEKGAKLKGSIVSSRTHEPVITSRILLTRADNTKLWMSTGPDLHGRFELTIPICPFKLQVTAPGYRPWIFREPDPNREFEVLQLSQESTKEMPIQMDPQ
jgi:hypothetical protein